MLIQEIKILMLTYRNNNLYISAPYITNFHLDFYKKDIVSIKN